MRDFRFGPYTVRTYYGPLALLVLLLGATVAVAFLAPPETSQAWLASGSVAGILAQSLTRSAFEIEGREGNEHEAGK